MNETYQVVDCVNGSSWAFPDRTIAMMCAAGVHVAGHEVEVVLLSVRDDDRILDKAEARAFCGESDGEMLSNAASRAGDQHGRTL